MRLHKNPDVPDNVIDKQPTPVVANLVSVMEHIISEGEEEAFQSETEYQNDQELLKFQPPTLPLEWGESKEAAGKQKVVAQFMAWVYCILNVLTILAILYTIFKKCQYVSSLPRVCFPLYPFSTIL